MWGWNTGAKIALVEAWYKIWLNIEKYLATTISSTKFGCFLVLMYMFCWIHNTYMYTYICTIVHRSSDCSWVQAQRSWVTFFICCVKCTYDTSPIQWTSPSKPSLYKLIVWTEIKIYFWDPAANYLLVSPLDEQCPSVSASSHNSPSACMVFIKMSPSRIKSLSVSMFRLHAG